MTAPISHFSEERTSTDGFIIVAVLWILGALSALVSVYAVYAVNTATGFAEYDNRLRAEAVVSAALELTAYRQLNTSALSRPTRGEFSFRLGQANTEVAFCSEAARIDLNTAPKPLLAGLFRALGASRDDADSYSDQVIAWRTASSNHDDSGPPPQSTALSSHARKANFPHANELSVINNIPIAIVERALPFVTVYSGLPQVNVIDAAAQIIAALPGMSPERVTAFLAQRRAEPNKKQELLQYFGPAQQYATTEGSRALRVRIGIAFDNGHRSHSEVVILLFDQGNEPFSVLSWRSLLDGLQSDSKS